MTLPPPPQTVCHLYIAQPPLYRIEHKKQERYLYSDAEKDNAMKELGKDSEKATLQRYKGLGEMNPQQLWDTTMNPEHRIMKQVTVDDAEMADKLFDILMGDAVEPRKNYIQAHASAVENLDI